MSDKIYDHSGTLQFAAKLDFDLRRVSTAMIVFTR